MTGAQVTIRERGKDEEVNRMKQRIKTKKEKLNRKLNRKNNFQKIKMDGMVYMYIYIYVYLCLHQIYVDIQHLIEMG